MSIAAESGGGARAWLELIRLPNVFTVPGDVLAGFCLAGGNASADNVKVTAGVSAAVLLYIAGMMWNDVADFDEDRVKRPARPLPSGRVSLRSAFTAGLVLCGTGCVTAFAGGGLRLGGAALLLALLVLLYDFGRSPAVIWRRRLSFVNMGVCRGGSLLLGAVTSGVGFGEWPGSVWLAAAGVTLYITMVSALAFNETGKAKGGRRVGLLLLLLLVMQAGFCIYGDCIVAAVVILAGIPLSKLLARRFYMT